MRVASVLVRPLPEADDYEVILQYHLEGAGPPSLPRLKQAALGALTGACAALEGGEVSRGGFKEESTVRRKETLLAEGKGR